MSILILPKVIFKYLTIMTIALMTLSMANWFTSAAKIFDAGDDTSVPTWFSSLILLISAILLHIISVKKHDDRYFRHWRVLAIIFLIMSIDEVARIHERIGELDVLINSSFRQGLFFYPWVIVGISFVVLVGLAYFRFLLKLPKEVRFLFLLSAFVFVFGALGLEMLSAYQHYTHGAEHNFTYFLLFNIEELFEKMGVIIFIYALLSYIRNYLFKEVTILIEKS